MVLVDDVYSSERDQMANTLCTYFEIPKRSLCVLPVLPQPDNLAAWIDRLGRNLFVLLIFILYIQIRTNIYRK